MTDTTTGAHVAAVTDAATRASLDHLGGLPGPSVAEILVEAADKYTGVDQLRFVVRIAAAATVQAAHATMIAADHTGRPAVELLAQTGYGYPIPEEDQ